jgi:methylaspartate ammonia-lyase
MTTITDVLAVPAKGACHSTDLAALQESPIPLVDQYTAESRTSGFHRVREIAEAVSVGLVLELSDQSASEPSPPCIVWGDCVAVADSGILGREPVFRAADGLSTIRRQVVPFLAGRKVESFHDLTTQIESLTEITEVPAPLREDRRDSEDAQSDGFSRRDLLTAPLRALRPDTDPRGPDAAEKDPRGETITVERCLHPAVRYGVSQALLKAVALTRGKTIAEVVVDEWNLPQPGHHIPIHAQTGADPRKSVDEMIIRGIDSLGYDFAQDLTEESGGDGEVLVQFVRWLRERIEELAGGDYRPTIHLDVHGLLGQIYDNNLGRILGYLYRLESCVQPYQLRLESPIIMDSREAQIETMKTLREYVRFRKMRVELVADEWANTLDDIRAFVAAQAADMIHVKMPHLGSVHNSVDAVLSCKREGMGALLGGSCTETDTSARVTAHVALATIPDVVMAKPGKDVAASTAILQNEMTRALATLKRRRLTYPSQ